mmetsp:Transcript_5853/g.12916  ORF Transcript_5853/g.12916 Transcript_5853/m.12916 type:complete len:243 (+) Transcript_5853:332-1060(+)
MALANASKSSLSMACWVALSRMTNVSSTLIGVCDCHELRIDEAAFEAVVPGAEESSFASLPAAPAPAPEPAPSLKLSIITSSSLLLDPAFSSTTEHPQLAILAVILAKTPSTSGPLTLTVVYPGLAKLSTSTSNSNSCPSSRACNFNKDALFSSTNSKFTKPSVHPKPTPTTPPNNPAMRDALMAFCALVMAVAVRPAPARRWKATSRASPKTTPPTPEKICPMPAAARVERPKVTPSVQST